jgi:hypothetical protein
MKLFVSEVNKRSLQLENTKHLFSYQQDNIGMFKLMNAVSREISLIISKDESKLLVATSGNDGEIFRCVFTADLQIITKKTSKLKLSGDTNVFQAAVDNNGNSVIALGETRYSTETFNGSIAQKFLVQTIK